MGAMQRTKGQAGERELARLIEDHTGWTVRRRVRQHEGDSDLEGVPGWSVECKRAAISRLNDWWMQAYEQSRKPGYKPAIPVLFYRLDRQPWRAMWPLAACMMSTESLSAADINDSKWWDIKYTVTGTIEAWATVARDVAAVLDQRAAESRGT